MGSRKRGSSGIRRERAREMRRNLTREEALLWTHLRGGALGVRFRRQHGIGPYIVDFACLRPALVVEADGGQHQESEYDARRDQYIRSRGFQILRFWNEDIWEHSTWVLRCIAEELARLDPTIEPRGDR
jgi:very-short-patch-repair endonuclease